MTDVFPKNKLTAQCKHKLNSKTKQNKLGYVRLVSFGARKAIVSSKLLEPQFWQDKDTNLSMTGMKDFHAAQL